jgi:hypothetical protein
MDIVTEAQNLYHRFSESEAFQRHVSHRMELVIPALLVFLAFSLACSAAIIFYIGGTRSVLVLITMLIAPFVLLGSLFVQVFVFFSWVEGRAIDGISGHPHRPPRRFPRSVKELRAAMGRMPEVPWVLAVIFLLVPFVFLVLLSIKWALLILVLLVLTPILYSLSDR